MCFSGALYIKVKSDCLGGLATKTLELRDFAVVTNRVSGSSAEVAIISDGTERPEIEVLVDSLCQCLPYRESRDIDR